MLAKLDSANPTKSEATGSTVSSETFTEDDIRPTASLETERVVQSEAAPVLTEDDADLEKLQDQFREFTEFLKWKKRLQENDLKTEGENQKVLEKRATMTELTEVKSPTDPERKDKPLPGKTERRPPAEGGSHASPQRAPGVLPLKRTEVRCPTDQLIDLERRDKPLPVQTERRSPAEGGSEVSPQRVMKAERTERSPRYSLHSVTGPDSLAALIAQTRPSQPSPGSSSKES